MIKINAFLKAKLILWKGWGYIKSYLLKGSGVAKIFKRLSPHHQDFMYSWLLFLSSFSKCVLVLALVGGNSFIRAAVQEENPLNGIPQSTVGFFLQRLEYKTMNEFKNALRINKMYEREKAKVALEQNEKLFAFAYQVCKKIDPSHVQYISGSLQLGSYVRKRMSVARIILPLLDASLEHHKKLSQAQDGLEIDSYLKLILDYYRPGNLSSFDKDLRKLTHYSLHEIKKIEEEEHHEKDVQKSDHEQIQKLTREMEAIKTLLLSQHSLINELRDENQTLKSLLNGCFISPRNLAEDGRDERLPRALHDLSQGEMSQRRYRSYSSTPINIEDRSHFQTIETGTSGYRSEAQTPPGERDLRED